MKECTRCAETKPLENFYAHSGNVCKACKVAASREWYEANRLRFNANQRARLNQPGVKERKAAYLKRYNEEHREELAVKQRNRTILRKYGLTAEKFDAMMIDQDSRCAICKRIEPLVVDHDHATGAVRALLCRACNTSIGLLEEDAGRMRAMAAYVERYV